MPMGVCAQGVAFDGRCNGDERGALPPVHRDSAIEEEEKAENERH